MTAPRSRGTSAAVLLTFFAACVVAFLVVDGVFVHTVWGQRTDDGALAGSVIGRDRIIDRASTVLDVVSVSALALAAAAVAAIGAVRRRPGLAVVAVLVLAGSNVTTQVLKKSLLQRPDLGVDDQPGFLHNTLPSGHTTVAMSVVAALLFVVPSGVRGLVALLGGLAAAAMGVATLSAGWHRPSDAVAAYLVVGAWVAAASALAVVLPGPVVNRGRAGAAPVASTVLLGLAAAAGLAVGILVLSVAGGVPLPTGRHHLLAEYGGSAALIAGAACAMTIALSWVSRAVSERAATGRSPDGARAAEVYGGAQTW